MNERERIKVRVVGPDKLELGPDALRLLRRLSMGKPVEVEDEHTGAMMELMVKDGLLCVVGGERAEMAETIARRAIAKAERSSKAAVSASRRGS